MIVNPSNSSENPLNKASVIDSKITSDGVEKTNIIRSDLLLKIFNIFQIKNLKNKDSISILKKHFGERIKKTIEVVFTKEIRGKSEINKILLNKYSDGKNLNEHFFTKLNRYYPMYEEYIFMRFSNEIEKVGNEDLNENYIMELMKNIINDFIKVIYIYGDKLSPVKFEKIFLDKELLNETYNKTINIYKNRYKYPDLIEMYRHLVKQELNDEKISMSESIENHFKSTLISLIDIFIHWKNSPGLEEDDLKNIIIEIKKFLNYSYILYKNNFAFGVLNPNLVRIKFRDKLINFFEQEIKENLNMDEVKQFKELLTNNGKIEFDNDVLNKYIEGFRGARKEKNIEKINENTLTNLTDANILTYIELSGTGSTTRIKLFINNILNIGKNQEIKIDNPFISSSNIQIKNDFVEFYNKKHKKHEIGPDNTLTLLHQAFITFDEKVKSKPLNEQTNLLYKFIEENNELFQILISWWRYKLIHQEYNGDKGKILKADINIYGTKELILSELEGTGIDVNIINGELSNGSAWPINRMLELHRKKFTHGPIELDNPEEFGLGEKGLIKDHIDLYTIDEYNIADEGVDELMELLSNKINNSNNLSFKNNFKIYSNHIKNIFTSNFVNEEDHNSKIKKIISRLPQQQQKNKKDIILLFMFCIRFQKSNNEIIKLHRIKECLKNRMEICNYLLAKKTNFKKDDTAFVEYLKEKIGCLKILETGEKHFDLDNIWKIRRFLKYTINISADLEKMIKKGEEDRTDLKQLSAKKFKEEIGEKNKITIGPRKKISRLLIKLMENYNGDLREIGDITRMRIVSSSFLESINAIKNFIISIHNHLDITQLVIEDKTGNPYERSIKPTGYRDVSLVLRLDSKNIIEIQFIIESIANFKNGIKANELLELFKNKKVTINENELNELLYQAKRLNKYLPEELLALYEGEIKKEDKISFKKGLILSSDDFYDLWRESKNIKFIKKMQFMESLPNKDAWAKIVTDTLKTILQE